MRIKESEKEQRRQLIIEKGMALIHSKGFNGSGVQEIANEVGIPKGSFYNYFKSKEEFTLEILDAYSELPARLIQELNQNARLSAKEKVYHFFKSMVDLNIQDATYTKGCLIGNICQELADQSQTIQIKVESLFNTLSSQIAIWLVDAKKEGQLEYTGDLSEYSNFILNSFEGALMRMKSQKTSQSLIEFLNVLNHYILK